MASYWRICATGTTGAEAVGRMSKYLLDKAIAVTGPVRQKKKAPLRE